MIKGPKDILILILAATCLIVSLVFLPWSELNFTGNFPNWLAGPMDYLGISKLFSAPRDFFVKFCGVTIFPCSHDFKNIESDYFYSLYLFIAMTAAAIAIVLIGKEDNSEKTVLQAKK